jgi:lipopolysaccharide/colanic/teichoic acid biosynthesis glycosyltransferase
VASLRRFIDIAVAVIVLPLLTPLFTIVSLMVFLESPGNPFYGGWRAGKGGIPFRMWKFRTMVVGANRLGGAITTRSDPRITRIGGFLRKTKIDELPQFINLLLGNLTLIGPRPEDPGIVARYLPEQREVLQMKPGITGPTQVHYTSVEAEAIPEENSEQFYVDRLLNGKILLDLEYQRKRTFFSDCGVLLETVSLILRSFAGSFSRTR